MQEELEDLCYNAEPFIGKQPDLLDNESYLRFHQKFKILKERLFQPEIDEITKNFQQRLDIMYQSIVAKVCQTVQGIE